MKNVLKSLLIVVGLPTLIAIVYYGFIASDIYVSETKFSIRSSKPGVSLSGMAALFSGSTGGSSAQESAVVMGYIHSMDLLNSINQKLDLRKKYSQPDIDIVARLKGDVSREEFLDYVVDKIEISRDDTSGIISLKAMAFEPALAQSIALEVITHSEVLINNMSERMENDTLKIAQQEVDRAAEKAKNISKRIALFRDQNTLIDPTMETASVLNIVSGIEVKLAEERAKLSEKRAYMREASPDVRASITRISSLEEQLVLERNRLTGGEKSNAMNSLLLAYQPLILEQELAREQYTMALASLESARIEIQRKKQYLITFVSPTLPDAALEPRRLINTMSVAMFAFLFYSVVGLMWSALKDHVGR